MQQTKKLSYFLMKEVKKLDILEVSVPKLETFKKRVVGPFTFRQFAVLGIAGGVDAIIMSCFGWQNFTELIYLLLLAIPTGAIGSFLFEPFPGVKMEKYLSLFRLKRKRLRIIQNINCTSERKRRG